MNLQRFRCSKLFFSLALFTLITTLSSSAMVFESLEDADLAAKIGAGSGGAICSVHLYLDINGEQHHKYTSGTLVAVDKAKKKGFILTVAHLFYYNSGQVKPRAVLISFSPNAVLEKSWIRGRSFQIDSSYQFLPEGKSRGVDLALVEFDLPPNFDEEPMLFGPKPKEALYLDGEVPLFVGSYGKFGLKDQEAWDDTKKRGLVKRIGHIEAVYREDYKYCCDKTSQAQIILSYMSLANSQSFERLIANKPYNFESSKTIYLYNLLGKEVIPVGLNSGDCGGPLFLYDADENNFRTLGIIFGVETAVGCDVLIVKYIAITPTVQEWINSAISNWEECKLLDKNFTSELIKDFLSKKFSRGPK